MQRITILGATGSIGLSTLDVIERHRGHFEVFALTAYRQIDRLAQLCVRFNPRIAVVPHASDAQRLRGLLGEEQSRRTEVLHGEQALTMVASHGEVTTVMAAIVGAAGLLPTMAAVRSGKRVLLANKEALVMAGPLCMAAIRDSGAQLLPIDSEHNAVFQALPAGFDYGLQTCGVSRVILTASGGPFRSLALDRLSHITPEEACAHPNWVMGRKISVDSATMMNKGLEVIEAHWLFGIDADRIEVLIHPQSVIHSMVEYVDGSSIAQLGNPDMRTPIAHALAYPERIASGVPALELAKLGLLQFETPDLQRFPCLRLAYQALRAGGSASAILNAANEVAVAAFLERRLSFNQISDVIERVLNEIPSAAIHALDDVIQADALARVHAEQHLQRSDR